MPPAKKTDQPSVVDQLAEDATPDEYPAGAPELQPYLQIRPRSKRAEFKRKYAKFAEQQDKTQALHKAANRKDDDPAAVADKMRVWADLDDLYQVMDELMELAAVDPDAYRKWADEAVDEVLVKVFQVFMKRSQPGEASSSTS